MSLIVRLSCLAVVVVIALEVLGCGGSPTSPAPTRAVVIASIAPNPVSAMPSATQPGYDVTFELTFRETGGVGGSIAIRRVTIQESNGRMPWDSQFTPGLTYSLFARGTVVIRNEPLVTVAYYVPAAAALGASLKVSYRITDTLGNVTEETVTAPIVR